VKKDITVTEQLTMPALVLQAVGDLRYEQVPVPALNPGEALIKIAAVGICGSDLPRIYEHGTYNFPLIPGHELAGIITQLAGPSSHQIGERVTVKPLIPCHRCAYCEIGAFGQCTQYDYLGSRRDGGFAAYVAVPQANLVQVPDGLSLIDAALTEPAAVALHALRQGGVQPGDVVAILGTGPIGMLLAQWARVCGAGRVLLLDIDPFKLKIADQLELGETFDSRSGDPIAWVLAHSHGGRGADLVLEAAGASITFGQALHMARPLGTVVLMGNPAGSVTLPQATVSQVLRKQLTIRGTWNSQFNELPVDEWQVVLAMAAAGRIKIGPLISHRFPLSEGIAALEMMRDRREFYNRVMLVNEI
jgi:L-iditol 2-dehydrogenase